MLKIKEKTIDYFKTISIPGVPKIVTTESYFLKLLWTVVILSVFGYGSYIISLSVTDYYKYDKITNIERVNPEKVTFPAIIICVKDGYWRRYYNQFNLIKTDFIDSGHDNISRIQNFLRYTYFDYEPVSYLENFKVHELYDCFRFNGFKNKSAQLYQANTTKNSFQVSINNEYKETINQNEFFIYSFVESTNAYSTPKSFFYVTISDNYLNSFDKFDPLVLGSNNSHKIEIKKESSEVKLPAPYNDCKELLVDEPYHQWNCIEACIFNEITNKYNCTFLLSLFGVEGLEQCEAKRYPYDDLKKEFSEVCLKECPLDSCFSEKITPLVTTTTIYGCTEFNFSFCDMRTLNITQIPKTDWFTFLNNIGGGLGLFMGIAFPNLIEFLQFIFEIFLIIFIRKIN